MTIEERGEHAGVDIHLDPEECELFMKLASDAEQADAGTLARSGSEGQPRATYFSVSVALGKKIRALADKKDSFGTI